MKNKIIAPLLVLTLIFCFGGCNAVKTEKSGRLSVVCSIFAPYDFARQIAGDRADVAMLLPPGVESHSYEPTPSDIISIENADLFFYVCEHTETWVPQIISAVSSPDVNTVDLAGGLGIEIHGHDHTHEHEHEEGETDEHIWTSPSTAKKMAELICKKMCEADPENAEYYKRNAASYIGEIENLRSDFAELISTAPRREIVSGSRFAMKNFTKEFGLKFTAAFDSCTDNTEPSAAVMAKIIDKINADRIPVIFYEELTEPKIARAVASETGAKMLLLHSCHNISAKEFKENASYVSLMRQNYNNLKEALK